MQEVHIKKNQQNLLACPRLGEVFVSLAEQKKRGVAIYVRQNIEAQMVYTDKEGRVLMVEVRLAQKKILLVNIYAPNCNQGAFYQGLHKAIAELEYEHTIDGDGEKITWINIQLSILGRIAVIKAYILPKWLYLFQNAPVKLDNDFLNKLERIVSKFVWVGR